MGFLKALIGFVKGIITGSFINKAIRKISDGLRSAANAIANYLDERGYHRAAKTVRHFARFVLFLGRQLVKAHTVYGTIDTLMDIEQIVDDVSIEGDRYTLVGPTYAT